MGIILDCACVHCEYYQEGILLGAAMPQGCFYFPALYVDRKKVIQIDIARWLELNACPDSCSKNEELAKFKSEMKLPYFESEMFEWNGCENEILSETPHLQAKYNYCPQCEQYGLQFEVWGTFE
jgi:hypothetical protein